MSLTTTLRKAAYAAPLVFAAAANVNAADKVYIEPSTADLSQPVAACVRSTPHQPSLTAAKKLDDLLSRQGLMIAGSANKLVSNGKGGKVETIYAAAKNLSGRGGYIVFSSDSKEKHDVATGFCLSPVSRLIALSPNNKEVPAPVNKGEMGIGLTNQKDKGSYTVIIGKHENGAIFAVHFNEKSNRGSLLVADGYGNHAADAEIYADFSLSDEMTKLFAAKQAEQRPTVAMTTVDSAVSPR